MVDAIFFLSIALVFYVYAGYPLLVLAFGKIFPHPVARQPYEPSVTVLIAAYNEETVIGTTITNKLDQDYPPENLEIIVISDASTDRTDAIVRSFDDPRVRLVRQEPRAGKTSALNLALPQAQGEVLVFSDANSLYGPGALRQLVSNFADPAVGYVTGKMIYASPDGSTIGTGCTSYMRYENALRAAETCLGSVVGVDGGIDAVRKKLYRPMRADQLPDFVLPLQVVAQGYRVVYDADAVLWEPSLKATQDEYRMRVRVSLRALWALFDMRQLLYSMGNPLFAWQLWSHKVFRYLCFVFLAAALASNIWLLGRGGLFYPGMFLLQLAGYAAAALMPVLERRGIRYKLLVLARYLALLNLASAHAFGKFLLRRKQVVWNPRKG